MGFLRHLDHMRGIAIVLVVVVHCFTMFEWPAASIGTGLSLLLVDTNILFIFISGYLFEHVFAEYAYRSFLANRLRNVILPYAICSIPAILIYVLHGKAHPFLPDSFFHEHGPAYLVGFFLLTGVHLGPLWFIPMIGLFYLATPVFEWLLDSGRAPVLLVPGLLLSETLGRAEHNLGPLQQAAHFAPVYLLGMLFCRHAQAIDPLLRRNLATIAAVGVTAAAASVILPLAGFHAPQLMFKLLICVAIYAALLPLAGRRIPALNLLARFSFGIFFVHGYLVGLGRELVQRSMVPVHGSMLVLAVSSGLVLGLSVGVTAALRGLIGARSRVVLGV